MIHVNIYNPVLVDGGHFTASSRSARFTSMSSIQPDHSPSDLALLLLRLCEWSQLGAEQNKRILLFLCVLGFLLEGLESLFGFLKLLFQLCIFRL